MSDHPLLSVARVEVLEPYLRGAGDIFRAFRTQDSGCISYGVVIGGKRWFIKSATTPAAVASLRGAVALHDAVDHPAIIPLCHTITLDGGLALVYPWVDGGVLYHPTTTDHGGRTAPDGPYARFRRLPVPEVLHALERILDAHLAIEQAGFVAIDFYDGCMLYDFKRQSMWLCDLDEYRTGPFTLDADRLPGSRRFMAPEELRRGARIDTRTTVHALGRALRLLLDAGDDECDWRGSDAQLAVVQRATQPEPADRFVTVADLARAWRTVGTMPGA